MGHQMKKERSPVHIARKSSGRIRMVTLEAILDRSNLRKAMKQVASNKGAAGIDGYKAVDVRKWFEDHPYKLTRSVLDGTYMSSPIRRVYIPKPNGEKRPLGIATVADRTLQTALSNVLSAEYDETFSNNSHGFRPGRGCQTAIKQAVGYANDGYVYVVDMDLRKFFDTVNHSKLLRILSKRVGDGRVIALVNKMLKAKVMDNGIIIPTTIGIPQGNAASPVLANILLNELDQELERRGHKFVRYADDMMVFCKSKRAAMRVMQSISKYIEAELLLQVNMDKTSVEHLSPKVKFLGFGFYWNWRVKEWRPVAHSKSKKRLLTKIKELLDRKCPKGIEATKEKLAQVIRGWANYFKPGIQTPNQTSELDARIRRRIRQIYMKTWKRKWTRYKELQKIHTTKWARKEHSCREVAFSSRGYWPLSQHANAVLPTNWLKSQGWTWVASELKI